MSGWWRKPQWRIRGREDERLTCRPGAFHGFSSSVLVAVFNDVDDKQDDSQQSTSAERKRKTVEKITELQ